MLTVIDLQGNEEGLVGVSGLNRKRRINGDKQLSFKVLPTIENNHSINMVQVQSKISFDGDIYIIKKINRKNLGKSYSKEVLAFQTIYGLNDIYKYNTHSGSMTFKAALDFVFEGTGYTYDIVDPFFAEVWENFGDDNRLSLFQKILERYKAEFELNDKHLTFKQRIGIRSDFQLRYGHNVKTYSDDTSTANLSTYIKGYGAPGIESEYISPNEEIFERLEARPVRDERYTTVEGLNERLRQEIIDEPEVSISIDFADMTRQGYPQGVPSEGSDIFVFYEPLNVEVEARIVEIDETFDSDLRVVDTKVTLSNLRGNITDVISSFQQTQKQVNNIVDRNGLIKYNVLDDAVKRSTEALQSAQAELEFDNGIIGRSKIDPNQLTIFNSEGFGISKDGGQTFTEAITADGFNLSAGAIGTLDANNVTIFGGDATDYTRIEGSFLESRGQFTRTWQGNTFNHDVSLEFQNGYFAARSLNDDRNLYYSNFGISTFASGNQNESSGTIEFFSYDYHPTRKGLTISSVGGVVALRSGLERVIIDAYDHAYLRSNQQQIRIQPRSHVVGNNTFTFHVVDNAEANEQDGVLFFGSENNGKWSSGLRFSKILNGNTLYVTNGDGDRGTGNLEAFTIRANKSFIGALEAPTDNAYVQVNGALRVTDKNGFNNGSPNYRDVAARDLYVSDVEARDLRVKSMRTVDLGSNFYIGVSTNELRVTDNLFYNGGNTGYKPIRASEFFNSSSISYKTNIEDLEEKGLDVLNNLQIKRYVLQSDVDNGIYDNWQVGVISELSPEVATHDSKAVNIYKMVSYSIKAIQELSEEVNVLKQKVNDLEMMQ